MDECIFCKIVKREVSASIVYEDDLTLAFMDIGHVNPGHTIVALKPHIANIYGLDDTHLPASFAQRHASPKHLKKPCSPPG